MSERESPLNFSGFSQETKNKISNVFQSIINGEKSKEKIIEENYLVYLVLILKFIKYY